MKILILITLVILPFSSFALDHRHMVRIAPNSFGFSTDKEELRARGGSSFDSVELEASLFSLNYHYRISDRWQIGILASYSREEFDYKGGNSGSSKMSITQQRYGVSFLYNFSPKLLEAYYLGLRVSRYNREDEASKNFSTVENKAPLEFDDDGEETSLVFGKRFSLKKWGLHPVTYSPSLEVSYRTHGKDLRDQKIEEGAAVTLTPVALDILF